MTDLAQKLAALSPEKRKLLEQKLRQQGKQFNAFPLSYAQQRLWFIDQLEPGNPAYNIPFAVRLQGKLNPEAVEKSLQQIVRRHEILRTTFSNIDGKGMQVIHQEGKIHLEHLDISHLNQAEQNKHLKSLIAERTLLSFDLSKGPLGQISLIRLHPEEWILLLVLHHIICDGWSMGVLIHEFVQFYQSFYEGKEAILPDLKIQYADFAQWQRSRLSGELREKQLSFWKAQLGSHPPVLNLPTDKPRPAINRGRGASARKCYPITLQNGIQQLSLAEQTTSFMTLLAAFNVLLSRYASQDEICVGVPIANRNRAELENLIGFFVNTLVIRSDLSVSVSFRQFLREVKETALNAFAHQDLPFEMIVEELQPERDMSYTPLFQVMFSHQPGNALTTGLPGLTISRMELDNPTSKFDLLLNLAETPMGLEASLDYNTDLFYASTMERMLRHFGILLQAIVDNPDQPIKTIPFMEKEEYHLIIREWNQNILSYPDQQNIAQLFEDQVQKNPGNVAVFYEGLSLSFDELNRQSNQLARHLLTLNLKPEDIVAILMDRSVEMIVAIMAILKAGGAYLPLDPAYPIERLEYMLEDSGAGIFIGRAEHLQNLAKGPWNPVDWDESAVHRSKLSDANLSRPISAENLAYVIYTSGSTGKPKGVMISHRSALNLAENLQQTVYAAHGAKARRISLNAPISFDASVQQIVMLTKGHGLYIIPQDIRGDGQALLKYIVNHQLEIVDCVPAQLRLLIAHGLLTQNEWKPLAFLPGGEALDPASWQAMVHDDTIKFYNMYGPTECTVDSTIFDVRRYETKPVIGRPVANARFYVLDPDLQPCAVGIPGELYIAGAGVARGYLNRPELTAEKFIPDPFFSSANGAERMYRSGDLVRYLEDGMVEFLGRIDHQVKVRGFRIELGEIENILERHPAVKDAVILVKSFAEDDKRLIAFLVFAEGSLPDVSELRTFLADQVPDYMVPSRFIILEKLPLNPSGKVDRRALLESVDFSREVEKEFVAPRTFTEEMVQKIFSEVLQQPKISLTDNFFDLGGHSLLATQVISRLRDQLAVDIPLRDLFHTPTIEGLAQIIERKRIQEKGLEYKAIERVPRDQDLPLSFAQQRLWFLDQLEPGSPLYNIPSAVRIRGNLDSAVLQSSLNKIMERHEILRTSIQTIQGKPKIVIHENLELSLKLIDFSAWDDQTQASGLETLTKSEARRAFHLDQAPLLRTTLVKLAEGDYIFLMVMHHIISDGWSTAVFVREIAQIYRAIKNNEPIPLPPLPIQYADFAHWQRNWLKDQVLDDQLNYWKKQLAEAPPLLELPLDRPRPAVQSFHGARIKFSFSGELSRNIDRLCNETGVTHFMLLMAAFQVLLSRYSGQTDICVGTPIANRNRVELEPLIGFFVNTLVIRSDLSHNPSFQSFLQEVRRTALDAYAHQDIPFEKILDSLNIERNVSHSPLFQVMFALQNPSRTGIAIPELQFSAYEMETATAKFDLSVEMGADADGIFKGAFEYNTDLFDDQTIQRMIDHFQNLLNEFARNPQQPVGRVNFLCGEEYDQIIHHFNHNVKDYPRAFGLHYFFEEQVRKTPHASALYFKGDTITYDTLNKRANQIAHFLLAQGVQPEERIGLILEKSFEMVEAIFGILKAGAAYVPIDPLSPAERLDYLSNDIGARFILTQSRFIDQIKHLPAGIVALDAGADSLAAFPETNPDLDIDPRQLAYVIYTSGSTGLPKGVMVSHQSVLNCIFFYINAYQISSKDRIIQYFNYHFDGSVGDFYMTLFQGATLYIPESERLFPDEGLVEYFQQNKISIGILPPAILSFLSPQQLPDLRALGSGGDICTVELARKWGKERMYYNLYGPTETTICCTHYLTEWLPEQAMNVPIGKPHPNFRMYILDAYLNPVPRGVPGELYIAGDGVARGYLNRPDLTAEKFIPDPFNSESGARMYRTGDICRFLEDGNIEFLGRNDYQVKIRGFRIELGEIENQLRKHPDISELVVVPRTFNQAKQLVAYIVRKDNSSLTIPELKEFLAQKLPEYMIPAHIQFLETLPYSSSGKIDRRRLPEPEIARLSAATDFEQAQTETEKILTEIWEQILGIKPIGMNDNFFELGGDSILSIQVIARAREHGLNINPVDLFKNQTIGQLARVVAEHPLILAEQGEITGEVPLTPIQHWFFDQAFTNYNHWNQSLMFEVHETIAEEVLRSILSRLIIHHDALRSRFVHKDQHWVQEIMAFDGEIPLHYYTLNRQSADEQKAFMARTSSELQASLDIEKGPILQIAYYSRGEQADVILLIIHHLVMDGLSWRILLADFQSAFHQVKNGSDITLPPKTSPLKFWAENLIQFAQSETLKSELPYWQDLQQKNFASVPVDFNNQPNIESSVEQVALSLDSSYTEALLKDSHKAYNTQINDLLLTALLKGFERWTGKRNVLLAMEGHGREEIIHNADISRTIGWFTSLYPVYLDLGRSVSIGDAIKVVKEQLRQIPTSGIGYGLLRYSGDSELRSGLNAVDRAEMTFNYLGQIDQGLPETSLFTPCPLEKGLDRAADNRRISLIDITCHIAGGKLYVNMTYSHHIHRRETMESFNRALIEELQKIIDHCRSKEVATATASDFKLANLDDKKLDKVLSKLGKRK